ncbi:hypothetical protein FACS1894172_11720 [Spirochaetia bacterium]|nr:hypothetical protein FACS1894172_11720 [Spirochaetia bacterium]
MLFYKYACEYVLGNIGINQLIDAAMECVSDGTEANNLYILAGLSEKLNSWSEILLYYKLTLDELKLKEPTKIEAVEYLIEHYCKELMENKILSEVFLNQIKETYYNTYNESNGKYYLGIKEFMSIYYSIDELIEWKYEENNLKNYNEIKNIDKEIENEYKLCYAAAKKIFR